MLDDKKVRHAEEHGSSPWIWQQVSRQAGVQKTHKVLFTSTSTLRYSSLALSSLSSLCTMNLQQNDDYFTG